ncbi:hypothetical protein ASZ90_017222 [hydrocarbon metagenome]|uniref:DUF2726 domain-containing protein n=1 Tax=hydrocarbon metagenome TaxID=938273 RepID=A0A0W8E9T0_9ZZZZ
MAQFIMLIVAIIIGKLVWDILNDYRQKMQPSGPFPGQKKRRTGNGEVIDISNAWINMDDLPYRKRDFLMSGKELSLYNLFSTVLENSSYAAFPRVNLEDVVTVALEADNRTEYFNRIKNRYVDILICEKHEMKPVLIIIGEGQGEPRKKQQILEDRFVRSAADAAGIKYLPINMNNLPDYEQLLTLLRNSDLNV